MLVYFGIALITTILTYLSVKVENKSRVHAFVLRFSAVIILCYFAGSRSLSVGTDTSHYIEAYRSARVNSFQSFFSVGMIASEYASLAKAVIWISVNAFRSSFWFYFILELFTVAPLLIACRKSLGDYMPLGIFIFSIVFYPTTFNIARQAIAMSFLLLQYCYINDHKIGSSFIVLAVAIGFHHTAILGLILYPLYQFGGTQRISLAGKVLSILLISGVVVIFSRQLLEAITMFFGQYERYTMWNVVRPGAGRRILAETWFLFLLLGLFGSALGARDGLGRDLGVERLAVVVSSGVAIFSLCLVSFWLYRIGLYFLYFIVLLIPLAARDMTAQGSRYAFLAIACIALAAVSFDYYGVALSNEVIPYEFAVPYEH